MVPVENLLPGLINSNQVAKASGSVRLKASMHLHPGLRRSKITVHVNLISFCEGGKRVNIIHDL